MKIRELSISHFMAIGQARLTLDDKGLLAIQGRNEDDTSQISNGSGKSTLPDALGWCIYGETARGETGDAVVNLVAKKDAEVITTIEDDDGTLYQIARYRKHKTHKNMLRLLMQEPGGWKDLTKGTDKLTQELVNKVVGCSKEVFMSAIYSGQEAMPDLPGMTDKTLKVLVEEAAGIDRLQLAYEIARQTMARRKLAVDDLSSRLIAQRTAFDTLETGLTDARARRDDFETGRANEIATKKAQLAALKTAFDRERGGQLSTQVGMVDVAMREAHDRIAGSDAERDEERRLIDLHNKALNTVTLAERLFNDQLKKTQQLKHALDHVDDKVGSTCSECGHVVEASDLEASRTASKAAAVDAAKRAKQLKNDLEDARSVLGSASDALAQHRATMTDVSAESASLSDLEIKRQGLDNELRAWMEEVQKIKDLSVEIDSLNTVANPHVASVCAFESRQEDLDKKIKELEEQRQEAEKALEIAEQAVRVFSPAGVRAHILDSVTPYLNTRTSHYLSVLTDGNVTAVWSTISTTAKGELREKFAIDVQSATGGGSFKSLSGGEKRKVRLACAMALQDLVASRATKPIQIWIADEIDHALDEAGLERLMAILEDKARDKGTVLVISHNSLASWIPNYITVTKKGGQATVDAACL